MDSKFNCFGKLSILAVLDLRLGLDNFKGPFQPK